MIAYVESNFILEVALEQGQAQAAQAIIKLAEEGAIEILFPAFAIGEPYSKLAYRNVDKENVYKMLLAQLDNLQLVGLSGASEFPLALVYSELAKIRRKEVDTLENVIERLLIVGLSIPTDIDVFKASRIYQVNYGLSPQDAIVYAAVIANLRLQEPARTKCFLSRDEVFKKEPKIKDELAQFQCRFIPSFAGGLEYIRSVVSVGDK